MQTPRNFLFACNLKGALKFSLVAFATVAATIATYAQNIPTDPQAGSCTVPQATFNSWFLAVPHQPSLNGAVGPADSINFTNPVQNCAFYQWSEQMFMWLTSPAPTGYSGGSRVFDTSVFYDVSPPDAGNHRTFLPHVPGHFHFFAVRSAQIGPHGLPVLMSKSGELLEVVHPRTAPSGNPLIEDSKGRLIEIRDIKVGPENKAIFIDRAGKPIAPALVRRGQLVPRERVLPSVRAQLEKRPALAQLLNSPALSRLDPVVTVQRFNIGRASILVNFVGDIVQVEQGQADDSVLLTQSNHLVYYATIANDVYTYFVTGVKDSPGISPKPTHFPTTQAELNQIIAFASSPAAVTAGHAMTSFTDANALTMEIKTAWVEASTLSNPGDYITTTGQIPVYTVTDASHWHATGAMTTTTLALVGMHVVGTANGHPEMIWATFEHIGNAPLATYQYMNNTISTPTTVNPTAGGTWLFSSSGNPNPFNRTHADYFNTPNVEGANGFPIGGSDTLRMKAFGGGFNQSPNPLDASTAASNTELISIHQSIMTMMQNAGAGADLRNNYYMAGSTWTENGGAPAGIFTGTNGTGIEVGTSRLANTTMETYQQGPDNNANGSNCFSCHRGNMLGDPGGSGLSHVYGPLTPLF